MAPHGCFRRLSPHLQQHLAKCGRCNPTPVQEKAIPGLLRGRSMLIAAGEGTGKTLAWLLAITHAFTRSQGRDRTSADLQSGRIGSGHSPVDIGEKVSPSTPSFLSDGTRSRPIPSILRQGEASGSARRRRDASVESDAGARGSVCVVLAPTGSHLLDIQKEVLPFLDAALCFPIAVIAPAPKPRDDPGSTDELFLQSNSRPRLVLAEPSALLRLLKKASLPKGKQAMERHRAGYRPSREEAERADAKREWLRSVRCVVVEEVDEIVRRKQLDDVRGVLTAICQPLKAARTSTYFQFVVTASSVTAEAERMMCTFVPSMEFDLVTAVARAATAAGAAPAPTTAAAEAVSNGAGA